MNVIYRVAHGFDFDIDGFIVTKYVFFNKLDDAIMYCNNIALDTGEILTITETNENFKKFYCKRLSLW